jgi:uncharacterized membrane protein YbhN (UPF0104 family)
MTPPPSPPALRRWWPLLRLLGGVAVLAVLLWHFGTGPFADAWRVTTWPAMLAALALTAMGTLTSAWRWRTVARSFGVPLSRRASVTAYYRSQFLNATLPGGILGDAHRAVRHGRDVGDVPAGLRATAWERVSGQVVQVGVLLVALTTLASPLRPLAPLATGVLLAVVAAGSYLLGRPHVVAADLRRLLAPPTAVRVVAASCASTAGHLAVFVLAVRTVGLDVSWSVLLSAGLVVLVGSSIPVSIAGWGPREGVTAWVFGAVGLGAASGLTVAVVYGVLAAVATLPGAVVLLADALTRRTRARVEVREVTVSPGRLEGVRRG